MRELRRSIRVEFAGSEGRTLAGIVDQPVDDPIGFLLFSHCFTCTKDLKAIVRISRRLAEHGWGVLRYDFSGLGNSQGDFADTNFTTNQADLRGAYDFLVRHHHAPVGLIGHSFGGAASLAMAESLDAIRGVVALAAPSDTTHLADLLIRMDPRIETQGEGEVTIGGRSYRILKQMVDDFRKQDLPAKIARLSKPVLILHSLQDETVGYHHALQIFSWVTHRQTDQPASPGASLITLQDSDHLLLNHPSDLPYLGDVIDRWMRRWTHGDSHQDHQGVPNHRSS